MKNPRVTLTHRKNGRWHIGNLDDAALLAIAHCLQSKLGHKLSFIEGKTVSPSEILDGAERVYKTLSNLRP